MIDKEKLKRRFSRNARNYDKYANVQKKMANSLVDQIHQKDINIKTILEIGCGTGYVTQRLINDFPNAQITAVDIAPGMIDYVSSIIQSEHVSFICGDIEEIDLKKSYDLIISNATFQWFNDFNKTVSKLMHYLDQDGILVFTTFGEGTFQELHVAFRKAQEMLCIQEEVTPSQSFYTLNELKNICKDLITRNQLKNIQLDAFEMEEREYFNDCTDFLYSVKKIGANNSQSDKSMMPPGFIEKVIEIYDKDFRVQEQVVATYHTLFFCIETKHPSQE